MALKRRCPSETALVRAHLSAHIVKPYEAFSTLQPEKNPLLHVPNIMK